MRFLLIGISILIFVACQEKVDSSLEEEILATVGPKILYVSQLEGMVTAEMSSEDSTIFVQSFIERWIRDQVLLVEAERSVSADLDIDALVEDYRSSLLRLNYEEAVLANELDSVISEDELLAFYEKNKDQYQLEKPILRCLFMQVPTPIPTEREILKLWNRRKAEDIKDLNDYASQYAESFLLSDSTWYTLEDISELIPSDIVNSKNINGNTDWTLKAKNFKYYLKVLEMKSRKDIAPLSFIQEQAARAVLHRRKLKIIDEWREALYEKALSENRVKVYTN